jgi:hypothetical protein
MTFSSDKTGQERSFLHNLGSFCNKDQKVVTYDSVGKLLDGERKSLGLGVVAKDCFSFIPTAGHVIMSIGKQNP